MTLREAQNLREAPARELRTGNDPMVDRRWRADAHRVRQRITEIFYRAIGAGIVMIDPSAVAAKALSRIPTGKFPAARTIEAATDILKSVEGTPGRPLTKLASRLLALTAVRSGVLRLAETKEFEDLEGPARSALPSKMKLLLERQEDIAYEFRAPLACQAVATATAKVAMLSPAAHR